MIFVLGFERLFITHLETILHIIIDIYFLV